MGYLRPITGSSYFQGRADGTPSPEAFGRRQQDLGHELVAHGLGGDASTVHQDVNPREMTGGVQHDAGELPAMNS